MYEGNEVIEREIFNSASGQWLESAIWGGNDDDEGGRWDRGRKREKGREVVRGCSGARKCPRPRGEKRVRVSLNNFDHTSRQSDTRAYEYIHLNAPRRPRKYCPDFLNGSESGRSAGVVSLIARGLAVPGWPIFLSRRAKTTRVSLQFFSPLASSSFPGQLYLFPETCKFMRCGKEERERESCLIVETPTSSSEFVREFFIKPEKRRERRRVRNRDIARCVLYVTSAFFLIVSFLHLESIK